MCEEITISSDYALRTRFVGRNQFADLVRGVLIFFACAEHFSFFLNIWYVRFFDSAQIFSQWLGSVSLYEVHTQWLGKHLPVDGFQELTGRIFIPWVTHSYIALSGFNLARTAPIEVRRTLPERLRTYLLLFAIFFAENLIVAPHFGIGISLFPITAWMLILMTVTVIYSYFGVRGIIFGFLASAAWNIAGNLNWIFARPMGSLLQLIHPWSSATEPLDYLPSCFEGLMVGFFLFQSRKLDKILNLGIWLSLVSAGVFLWLSIGSFKINPYSVFDYDELLQSTNAGLLFIFSVIALLLLLIQKFKDVQVTKFLKGLQFVGIHALGIFLVHRILFLKVFVPLRLHIGSYLQVPVTNSFWEIFLIYFPLTVGVYWLLLKNRFFGELFLKSSSTSRVGAVRKY